MGCSVAKGLGKPIGRTTSTRVDKVFSRLSFRFVEKGMLRRSKIYIYILLNCGDFSRFKWAYVIRRIPDTVPLFEKLLASEHVAGTPSAVEVVRSHEGGEFEGDVRVFRTYQ